MINGGKASRLVRDYPASTLTPLFAAFMTWVSDKLDLSKSDQKFAAVIVVFFPAIVTIVKEAWPKGDD